jgi:hypothetical protein
MFLNVAHHKHLLAHVTKVAQQTLKKFICVHKIFLLVFLDDV